MHCALTHLCTATFTHQLCNTNIASPLDFTESVTLTRWLEISIFLASSYSDRARVIEHACSLTCNCDSEETVEPVSTHKQEGRHLGKLTIEYKKP